MLPNILTRAHTHTQTQVLSIPLAWWVLRLIGVNYFGFLNMMSIFIVCAIGADDIFVFMDAYVQSQYKGVDVRACAFFFFGEILFFWQSTEKSPCGQRPYIYIYICIA